MIVVSHDRAFMESVTTKLFVVEGGGAVSAFEGFYSEYVEWQRAAQKEKEREEREKEKR